MANCVIKYANDENVNKAIIAIADNNAGLGFKLANMVYGEQFNDFLTKKKLNINLKEGEKLVTKIPASKLKDYIRSFYNRFYLDIASSSREQSNISKTLFTDARVANTAREHFAYVASFINNDLIFNNDKNANNPYVIIHEMRNVAIDKLYDIYDRLIDEGKLEDDPDLNEKAIAYTCLANLDRNDDTDLKDYNYITYFLSLFDYNFIEYIKNNTKVSKLFSKYDITQDPDLVYNEDGTYDFAENPKEEADSVNPPVEEGDGDIDSIDDVDNTTSDNSNSEVRTNAQWDFGNDVSNFKKFIDLEIKSYFNFLPRLADTSYKDGVYNFDTNNPLGCILSMNYEECSTELFNMVATTDAGRNIYSFVQRVYELANNKKEFAGFIRLYNDMVDENGNITNFGYKIFYTFRKPIVNVSELTVTNYGNIRVHQSNNGNSSVRTLFYNMIDDLKFSIEDASLENHEDRFNTIKTELGKLYKYVDSSNNNSEFEVKSEFDISAENYINEGVSILQYIFKQYFPDFRVDGIDKYINGGKTYKNKIDRLNSVINIYETLYNGFLTARVEYNKVQTENRNKFIDYYKEYNRYLEESNIPDAKVTPPRRPEFNNDIEYLTNLYNIINDIAILFDPYVKSDVKFNSSNVEGNMSSDVGYNNYILTLQETFEDEESLRAYMEEKLEFSEYDYSSILIADPSKGIYGLFEKTDTGYRPTSYAKDLIRFFKIGGIKNYQTGNNSMYNNMSDNDYFALCFNTFLQGIDSYFKYNKRGDESANIPTAFYAMPIPADAPNNYFCQMPRYAIDDFIGYDQNEINNYIRQRKENFFRIINADPTNVNGNITIKACTNSPNEGGVGESFTSISGFTTKIMSVLASNEVNVNTNNLIFIDDKGNLISTTSNKATIQKNASTKAYYVLRYSPTGNIKDIAYSALIEVELDQSDIKGFSFDSTIKVKTTNNIQFYNNVQTNDEIQDDALIKRFETIWAEEYKANNKDKIRYNRNSAIFNILRNYVIGEIEQALRIRSKMFDAEGNLKPGFDLDNYILDKNGNYQKNGKYTGNAFKLIKLYDITLPDGTIVSMNDMLKDIIDISSTGDVTNINRLNNEGKLVVSDPEFNNVLDEAIIKWFNAFIETEAKYLVDLFNDMGNNVTENNVLDFITNYFIFINNTEDLFQGSFKFYPNAKSIIKRLKENQAGGSAYGLYSTKFIHGVNPFRPEVTNINGTTINAEGNTIMIPRKGRNIPLTLRTGYRAVVVENIIRGVRDAKVIYDRLISAGCNKDLANQITSAFGYITPEKAEEIARLKEDGKPIPYELQVTKVDDAQSYTSIYEAIRRIVLKGDYPKYEKLIAQLLDDTPIEDINAEELQSFIQAVKNYYYDLYGDKVIGMHRPRQIKNAEFILIPKLLEGTQLADMAQWMIDNDIDQLNTKETSKASNSNVLHIWDANDDLVNLNNPDFDTKLHQPGVIANYSYTFLYEQSKTPQHLKNAQNKAGVQIMKKILDNISNKTRSEGNQFIACYIANIQESFDNLCESLGVKFDKDYNIINVDGSHAIDFSKLYEMGLRELRRLGADENLLDYMTIDKDGNNLGETIMPIFANIVGNKLENIAQSIINNHITIQKINGGHLVQITDSGLHASKLKVNDGENLTQEQRDNLRGITKRLRYYPDGQPIIEVKMPRWAAELIGISEEDIVNGNYNTMIGYRIPTEGKQSIAVLKVVGLLPDAYGSTIAVPDGWVTQTGADFDIDSIYTMMKYLYKDKNGVVKEIPYVDGTDENSLLQRYIIYVRENSTKEAIRQTKIAVTREDREAITQLQYELALHDEKESDDYYKNLIKDLISQDSELYNNLPDNVKKVINSHLQSSEKYYIRVNHVISFLNSINKDDNTNKFLEHYKKIADALQEYYNFKVSIYDNIADILVDKFKEQYISNIKARAKLSGLMSLEEFSKLSVERQNSRKARTNRMINAGINIIQDPKNAEEIFLRSNFDGISEANKLIDQIDLRNKINRQVYSYRDQIQFRRNAIGGLALKAFSVTRDNLNSINNYCQTTISQKERKITIYYDPAKYNKELISQAYNATLVNIDIITGREVGPEGTNHPTKQMIKVVHDQLAWSKNNRNVVGYLITAYSSQTTAHILDAVKEGAIPNENTLTFGAYKTLLDLGTDHYTAMLWLRQPAITELCNVFFKSESSFNRVNGNVITNTIKELAKRFELNGKKLGKNFGEVNEFTPIDTIIENLNSLLKVDVIEEAKNIVINPDEITEMYLNTSNDAISIYKQIKQIYMFKNIKELSNIIERHGRVLNLDKSGAKQTLYQTYKVFEDINSIYTDGIASVLKCKVKDENGISREVELLEGIYPGSSTINFIDIDNIGIDGNANHYNITKGIQKFLERNSKRQSAYPTANAFLRYATSTSYLLNSKVFPTQREEFVDAIKNLEIVLNRKIDESTYNDFKKYVINYMVNFNDPVLKYESYIGEDGKIICESTDNKEKLLEYKARIFGYGFTDDIEFDPYDVVNPSNATYEKFRKLSPAQKVEIIKRYATGSDNIFNYLKVNLYSRNANDNRGISQQTILFNADNVNLDYIHQLFMEAFNNSNRLVRDAALDLIKYAYIVEGNNYSINSVSKIISNKALYTSLEEGGTNIANFSRHKINYINADYCFGVGLYEQYIRSHTTNKFIPVHRLRKVNGSYEKNYIKGQERLRTYLFDLNNETDFNIAKNMGIIKEDSDGNYTINNYIVLISANNNSTLYKILWNTNSSLDKHLFLYPLNKLDSFEYGETSTNIRNREFISSGHYMVLYNDMKLNSYALDGAVTERIEILKKIYYTRGHKQSEIEKKKYVGVPIDPHELSNLGKDSTNNPTISALIRNIKMTFNDNARLSTKIFYLPSRTPGVNDLHDKFVKPRVPSFQLILNKEGSETWYSIERQKFSRARYKKNEKKVAAEYKADIERIMDGLPNEADTFDDFYIVTRIGDKKRIDELNKRKSSVIISDTELSAIEEVTGLSDLGILNVRAYSNMTIARNRRNDQLASSYISRARYNKININSARSIEDNKVNSTKILKEYYNLKAKQLLELIDNFSIEEFRYVAIDDPDVIASIIVSPELRIRFMNLILEVSTFGDEIEMINKMDRSNLTDETKDNLDSISAAIASIKNNPKIRNAMIMFFNEYVGGMSTNLMISEGFTTVHDMIETDENLFAFWFGDSLEINGAATQLILKIINNYIKRGEFAARERARQFRKEITELEKEAAQNGYSINPENMINYETAHFKNNFTDKFLEDKRKIIQDHFDLIRIKGTLYDKDVVRSAHAKDVWFYENVEQEYIKEYYKELIDSEEPVLADDVIDYYIRYRELNDKRKSLYNKQDKSADDIKEMNDINEEIRELTDPTYVVKLNKETNKKIHKRNAYNNQKSILESKIEDLNKQREDLINESKDTKDIDKQIKDYTEEINELNNKIEELTKEINNDTKNNIEINKKIRKRSYYTYKQLMLNIEIKDLNRKRDELINNNEDTKDIDKKIIQTVKELNEINNRLVMINNEVDVYTKDNKDYKAADALYRFIQRRRNIENKYFASYATKEWEDTKRMHEKTIYKLLHPGNSKTAIPISLIEDNPAYKEAAAWLEANVIYGYDEDFSSTAGIYFSLLSNPDMEDINDKLNIDYKNVRRFDYRHVIDGRTFTANEVLNIKKATEEKYDKNKVVLIRNKPTILNDDIEVYNEDFYNGFKSPTDKQQNEERNKTIEKINEIIINAYEPTSGKIFISRLTLDELVALDKLYEKLYDIDARISENSAKVKNFIDNYIEFVEDSSTINIEETTNLNAVLDSMSNDDEKVKYRQVFDRIIKGAYGKNVKRRRHNGTNSNRYIYQYPVLKRNLKKEVRDRFIDKERTEAIRWIKNNTETVKTEYYYQELDKANASGKSREWILNNHTFNPYTNTFEPLRIWTTLKPSKAVEDKYKVNAKPVFYNRRRKPYDSTINENYKKYGHNYNGNSQYALNELRNPYEIKAVELMQRYIQEFSTTNFSSKLYYDTNRAPMDIKAQNNIKNIVNSLLAVFGIDSRVAPDRGLNDNVDFIHDKDVPNPLMSDPIKNYQKSAGKPPIKLENETDEQYKTRLDAYHEKVKKIDAFNKELHKNLADKDYKSVFEKYILRAVDVQYKEQAKTYMYMLMEYYKKYKDGYQTNWAGNLRKDYKLSTDDANLYKRQELERTIRHLEILANRIFNNQFKPKTGYDRFAALMQNMTSAKFMMFNFKGGISNILTGESNILYEAAASQYFNHKQLLNAKGEYFADIHNIMLGINKDTSLSFIDGFIKLLNIVDKKGVQEIREDSISIMDWMENARDFAYSPQTAGEHLMQNTTLIAMAHSNKLLKTANGVKVVDENYYRYLSEFAAIKELTKENDIIKYTFDNFIATIKKDDRLRYKYETYTNSLFEDFFTFALDSKSKREYGTKYIKLRKEIFNKYMEEYEKLPELISQFELKDGYVTLKKDAAIDWMQVAEFANKVIAVNKQIHGVYDKIGAATIESTQWFGSLLMQYHKHIWNGYLKHFRVHGYYNETTQSRRKGMYISLYHFLSKEFNSANFRVKRELRETDKGLDTISLYLKLYSRALLDTILNIQFNYELMSEDDRANIRRILSQLSTTAASILVYFGAAYYLYNDDENLVANWALYSADRWLSENNAWNFGMFTELPRVYSNPFAALSSLKDYYKISTTMLEMLMEGEDYNPYFTNGQYSGENKLYRYVTKQIPMYRGFQAVADLDSNNRYYKFGDNLFNIIPTNDIIAELHGMN